MKKSLFLLACIISMSTYAQTAQMNIGALGALDSTHNPRYAVKIMDNGSSFWIENYTDMPMTVNYTINTDSFVPGKMGGLIDIPAHKAFVCPKFHADAGHIAFVLEDGKQYPESAVNFDFELRAFVRPR